MTDDEWLEACDGIMETLVDAGCGGCHVSAALTDRYAEVGFYGPDAETVLELLSLGLEAKRHFADTKAHPNANPDLAAKAREMAYGYGALLW